MKAREQRRRVATKARMRTNAGWSDVTISDISSRGMGLRSSRTPCRGEYIELCRHHHKLVGRVMWQDDDRFGVLLSDAIIVDDLLTSRPSGSRDSKDRRRQPRRGAAFRPGADPRLAIVSVEQNSRHASRLINFAAIVAIACIGAGFAATLAASVLSGAMESVEAALATRTELSID